MADQKAWAGVYTGPNGPPPVAKGSRARWRLAALAAVALAAALLPRPALAERARLLAVEQRYADFMDAQAARDTLESGLLTTLDDRDLAGWQTEREQAAADLRRELPLIDADTLADPEDRRALAVMRANLEAAMGDTALAPDARCADAGRRGLPAVQARAALYACFDEHARAIPHAGTTLTRVAVFQQLGRIDSARERKALFLAMQPLWRAVNGRNTADSPYRRMLRATVAAPGWESPIAAAAGSLGITPAEAEAWLVAILEAWRRADTGRPVEPWDYRYRQGAAARQLHACVPQASIVPTTLRYYRDLGADLEALGIVHDLEVRPGKAPLAYASVLRYGRERDGRWQPATPRVSANVQEGGFDALNEIIHEDGHAVQFTAIRTRPAFASGDSTDDALYWEAFAEVATGSMFDPAWQRKYLGCAADAADSLRAQYGAAMLDVAWGLFEIRMLRDPAQDPNRAWTEITHHYLHIVPHPEWSWWVGRAQLVESPGYMVTYALGTALTADLRARTAAAIGPFTTGNPQWYRWLAENLLADGARHPTRETLRRFLGRAPSPEAVIAEIGALKQR